MTGYGATWILIS